MLTVEAARDRIVAVARQTDPERIPVGHCLGRVLANPELVAHHDVPPFANSAMDGYAVRAADLPGELRVAGEVQAGVASLPVVTAGSAVRIMTGAPMPAGADTVVPIELTDERNGMVVIPRPPPPGANVRVAGLDTRAGDTISLRGEIGPAGVALLASLGLGEVEVRRRPRVAVLSTGDELVAPGEPLRPGQIHDTNGPALAAAVAEAGGEPLLLDRAGDDPAQIEACLRAAAEQADLIVTSGGVSVGRYDHVRGVVEQRGSLDFWRIAVQPGKPLAFGEMGGRPIVGLPGNPVSALVTFELFVRPLLRAMLGLDGDGRLHLDARVDERLTKDVARRGYLRARISRADDGYVAVSAGGQSSSQLRPLADANALLVVPEGVPETVPGERYAAIVTGAL